MAVTIIAPHPERYTKVVLPRAHGYEERDVHAYPLPPSTNAALLDAVCKELRDQGHTVSYTSKRERLVSWDETHRRNERSFCSDEDWQPNPKGPVLLRFVGGGWWVKVICGEKETVLQASDLRRGRDYLKFVILGRT